MSATDRRTRAQLIDALAGARDERDQAVESEEDVRAALADLDLEAKVIAGCVASIDLLPAPPARNTAMYAYDDGPPAPDPGDPRIVRVLAYLARRYGLPDPHAQVEQLTDELARVNADLHRTRAERDELRHGIERLRHPDPQF